MLVILAHSGPDLVPQFEEPLRLEALKSLEKKGVQVILNTRVTEVGDGFAKLSTKKIDEATGEETGRDESTLPVGLSVWCAGTAPVSFVSKLLDQLPDSARSPDGRINVDKWLRPPMEDESLLGSVNSKNMRTAPLAAFVASGEPLSQNAPMESSSIIAGLAPISKPPLTKTKAQQTFWNDLQMIQLYKVHC